MRLPLLGLALVLAAAPRAQIGVGRPVPSAPLAATTGAIEPSGANAPTVLLLAFHRRIAEAATDGDLLRALQTQHAAAGLRVAVVVEEDVAAPKFALPSALQGLALVGDVDGALRQRWLGSEVHHCVLVRGGTVVWMGWPEQALAATVAQAMTGALEPRRQRDLLVLRSVLVGVFDEEDVGRVRQRAADLVQAAPTDGVAWALGYVNEADRAADAAAAAALLDRALPALAPEPRPLAVFADIALRGDPRSRTLGERLVAPLGLAATAFPDDLHVQLAHLRALVRAGRGRDTGRLAQQLLRKVKTDAPAAIELCDILSQDTPAAVHKDAAQQALKFAHEGGAEARLLAAARYAVLRNCGEDAAAAKAVVDDYLEQFQARVSINNDAWNLMTELPTRGRFPSFALALVERMLESREVLDFFECDTAALAMFLAGRTQEAVELQQRAVDGAGTHNREYRERLHRYQVALPAMPR